MTKRIKSIFLLTVLCLSMVISLAGCGTSDHTCLKCGGFGTNMGIMLMFLVPDAEDPES